MDNMKKLLSVVLGCTLLVACAKHATPNVGAKISGEAVVLYGANGNPINADDAGNIQSNSTGGGGGGGTVTQGTGGSSAWLVTVNNLDGSVDISSMPAITGTVAVSNLDGSVAVSSLPQVYVADGGPSTISGVSPGVQACTPSQFYAVNAAVVVDAGHHYFYSGSCFNRGATAQYFQLQATSTGPLQDAGPACLQWYVPASNSEIFLDPKAPGGADMAACTAGGAGLAPGAISFDVSGSSQFYVPDAGNLDCHVCWL